jgi:hypothetical protein
MRSGLPLDTQCPTPLEKKIKYCVDKTSVMSDCVCIEGDEA